MFSELVDRCVRASGRPDSVSDLAYAVNWAFRQIQRHTDWDDDSVEEIVAVPLDTRTVIWTPEVGRRLFRRIEYVEDGCLCQPRMVRPGRRMIEHKERNQAFYYASGDSYVFANVCHPLRIYYWRYWPVLQYYPHGARPAEFDFGLGEYNTNDPALLDLVTNWILDRHNDLVFEGAMAHFYRTKQDPRNQLHYAAFNQGMSALKGAESANELVAR